MSSISLSFASATTPATTIPVQKISGGNVEGLVTVDTVGSWARHETKGRLVVHKQFEPPQPGVFDRNSLEQFWDDALERLAAYVEAASGNNTHCVDVCGSPPLFDFDSEPFDDSSE